MGSTPQTQESRHSLLTRGLLLVANTVWLLVMVILVVLALYVGIGRQLLGSVDDYRSDVEALLSERLGQPVTIGSLEGQWQILDPVLRLRDLEVHDPVQNERVVARVGDVHVRLDSLISLLRGRLVFGDLTASSLDIAIEQLPSGAISIDGIPLARASLLDGESSSGGPRQWINLLGDILSDPSIRLNQVRLGLNVPGQEPQTFFIPQVNLHYIGGTFSAYGRAMQPGATTQLARFYLEGAHFFRGDFDGRLYVSVDSGRLFDSLIQRYNWREMAIMGFDVGGEAWLHFSEGELEAVNAKVLIPHLQVRAQNQTQAPLESVSARVGWRRQEGERWQLDIEDLTWRWTGRHVAPLDLQVIRNDDWMVKVEALPLGVLSDMAAAMAPVDAVRQALGNYRPAGTLADVTLDSDSEFGQYHLSGTLSDVSVAAYDGAPAASGVNGTLTLDQSGGQVSVDTRNMTLDFPELYLDGWTLDTVRTQVNWQMDGQQTRVWADDIAMTYQEKTSLEGAFELELNQQGDDTLSLRVGTRNGTAGMVADFIPAKEVNREFYNWISTAISQANVEDGVFYGHGQVNEGSPPGSFTTSMRFSFNDTRLKYDEAWPEVEGAAGVVVVHNGLAHIRLDKADVGTLPLSDAEVFVDGDADPVSLKIKAAADFNEEGLQYWLAHSPLGESAGSAMQKLAIAGQFHLDLDLGLTLGDNVDTDLDLSVGVRDGRVAYGDSILAWTGIEGKVDYTSATGFGAEPVKARFLGSSVDINLSRLKDSEALRIIQKGRIDLANLPPELDFPALPGISGRAHYSARLDVTPDSARSFTVESSLSNVAIDWPMPVGKSVGEQAPLNALLKWTDDDAIEVSGRWSNRLAYRLRWQGEQFDRGRVEFGADPTVLPETRGLDIVGPVERLDLEQWQAAIEKYSPEPVKGDLAAGDYTWLHKIALTFGKIMGMGQSFSDVSLTATPDTEGWALDLQGPDVAGQVRLPADRKPISVNLEKIALVKQASTEADTAEEPVVIFEERGVGDWPDVNLSVNSLTLNQRDFGAWSLLVRPSDDNLSIRDIQGSVGTLVVKGSLNWGIRSGLETTEVKGEIAGENLADISPWLNGSVPLKSEKARVDANLQWLGAPGDAAATNTNGDLSFRIDDGVILEGNNTAQIFRVFGILNSDTLWRRLKLDFSDLYEAGVAFDAISGKALLESGVLKWDPELQIVGPSGAFKLTGTTDLASEGLDMRLVVVLPLTQNLPLAAILMGASAPIGGALFVLDKVLGDPLSKLTSATYSVGGTWDQPEVNLRNVFDTGN
ncbi:YhdP family protein [Marinobacter sp. V034]|uniref:YhdP family protein n=1 Tax=Marinobacter sp. V034 TaxID=3459610 RepID=UPI004044E2F8